MKDHLAQLLDAALAHLAQDDEWPEDLRANIQIERTKDPEHGNFATNLALTLAKPLRANPRQIAERICKALPASEHVTKTEIAGPGFINFFLAAGGAQQIIKTIVEGGSAFGQSQQFSGQKIQVEFASVNPTGPLHVGHGRGAAYGDCISNLLAACGAKVEREYYVNDAGRQMDILGLSVWLRYLQACGESFDFPVNCYQGDYVVHYANQLLADQGEQLRHGAAAVFDGVHADEPAGGDKELHVDDLIAKAKALLGDNYSLPFKLGLELTLAEIREDLGEFGVRFDNWFSEQTLMDPPSQVAQSINTLIDKGLVEERGGAQWIKTTEYGDDKDRVVQRDNGLYTYFASDIAYHANKFARGYDRVINVWGADHHGYIARVKAALQALELDPEKLDVALVQLVTLYRGGEKVKMSTRKDEGVSLRELRAEVGNDAARYFYIMRRIDQSSDFDLELAKSQSKDNPVYYIQYAHARACSVMRKLDEHGWQWHNNFESLDKLDSDAELALMKQLERFPEVVNKAAAQLEPHALATYLRELAGDFHTWYNGHKMLIDDAPVRNARLALSAAVRQVIANGLALLGVSAPEAM